ncbi:trace amine-associated receptor 7a [Exaiptasia diaphana]|uniref:G-protein coupled receptors family 1 profile domain-containing protein n=1 Tax=Exaiptasia diaphana TaxID=2652724 RepID=A0A913YBI8_EXADI|nr:trace amine-associated receptor 7a [Exaiptasia diaphana]XP_020917857.1 trace amine-associated receptor 7a [Exaiptasia diaphana]XP_028512476.1 trace amine-associated receptor 7a [Exaiptasia diaphana]
MSNSPVTMTITYVALGFLAFFIIITNLFVMFLIYNRRSLRTPTNLCLASLAASDFMAGSIAIPLIIMCNVSPLDGLRQAMDFSSRFISISTVIHLLIVTIERYIMICHGMKYNLWINTKRVVTVLVATWLFSAVATLIQLFWKLTQTEEQILKVDRIYDTVCLCCVVIIPLIIMAASYVRIFIALRYQLQQIQRYNNPTEKSNELRRRHVERKAAIIFGCMIITFTLCWFSYFIDGLNIFTYSFEVSLVLMFLRYVSPFINPLLYTFLKEDFKLAVKMSLCQRFREASTNSYLYQSHFAPSNSESAV